MIDITHKPTTLRRAIAEAIVSFSSSDTVSAIRDKRVPKGDVLEAARVAGLLGIKRTPELIPDCHPMPIEHAALQFELGERSLRIVVEVATVYRTGVEVEAMHGASVAALTAYDMLKPIDKGIEIGPIRLVEKHGGKSEHKLRFETPLRAGVLVISDLILSGKKSDTAGSLIAERLSSLQIEVAERTTIAVDAASIREHVERWVALGLDLIVTAGGTGVTPADITPEVIAPLFDRELPGVMEAARSYGQARTSRAMMSRSLAGVIGGTLVLCMPGSTRGARETLDALFPGVLQIVEANARAAAAAK